MFPSHEQQQVRNSLGTSLRGVVSQVLCRRIHGGRVAAVEVMMVNRAIGNLIREQKLSQIYNLMQTGRGEGNQIMNFSLAQLVRNRQISIKEAESKTMDKKELAHLYS